VPERGPRRLGNGIASRRRGRRWCAIELNGTGKLSAPVIIAAFEGWNDAGEAASGVITHLTAAWQAEPVGSIDPEDYYDFQVTRPVTEVTDGSTQSLIWPTTRLLTPAKKPADRDIVLVHGIEPNMRWRSFCEELFDLARDLGVTTIVALGALLADVPHTRPVPVSGSSNNEELQSAHGLDKPTLQGPTGINGVLQEMARHEEIELVSFWAAVPHYVAQAPCPKATLALIRRIEDVLDLTIPLGELPEEARAWETGVDELAAEDSEVAEYVRTLEEAKDTAELPEASGEAIAREFERYLRRHERRRRGEDGPA
jgi:predicted ATP-grasp superfamily ATP-dependent carboligase